MELFSRYLTAAAVVLIVVINVAGGKSLLLSLATIAAEQRETISAPADSTNLTQIWLDSRDPDPAVIVHDNGTMVQWGGDNYHVVSVVQCGVETLYICSRDESLSDGWLRIIRISRNETNPLKLALSGRIISEYFTPQVNALNFFPPFGLAYFPRTDYREPSRIPPVFSPPPRIS